MIPKLIHQTWKTNQAPEKWLPLVQKVQSLNPEWEYKLWSDADNDEFVKREYPDFHEIFTGFSRGVMRADVIRYLIMYKLGGVYLDLDYEMLKPFDFEDWDLVLPLNRSIKSGDKADSIGNCFFASVPGHPFWLDVIDELKNHPPVVTDYTQIVEATGPLLLTRIFYRNAYQGVCLPERMVYHPPSPHSLKDLKKIELIKNNGISLGIHYTWSSWKERWSLAYVKEKAGKIFK
jgi:mannosyltransferase OCH1-like enzyme